MDGAREDLADLVIVHEMREIQELCSAHDQFKSTLGDADKEFASISAIEKEIERLVEAHDLDRELLRNPYTDLAAADIRRKWGEVQQAVPRRDGQLQSELRRQQNNERLRTVFADKANQVGPWLEKELERVRFSNNVVSMKGADILTESCEQTLVAWPDTFGVRIVTIWKFSF
ncbi:unnamed protein product [Haemonchus placei]|uniref:Uncharacterized protein n=1 Tax=Haemonchus placei TaxID=6290 RepID=A0A3P7WVL5_HAEPC|nr:unnamed protein product [Haemonchus placei]